jgi:hypothetical protein
MDAKFMKSGPAHPRPDRDRLLARQRRHEAVSTKMYAIKRMIIIDALILKISSAFADIIF